MVAPHIRRLGASLLHHARGFCHTVDAGPDVESSSLSLLRILEKRVDVSGKHLVVILRRCLQEDEQAGLLLLKEKDKLLEEGKQRLEEGKRRLEEGKQRLEEGKQRLEEGKQAGLLLLKEKERLLREMEKHLQSEMELRAKDKIELLRARGFNDVRGLFELIEERLAQAANIKARKKGTNLWEAILSSDADLAACIERCTNGRAANTSKQALHKQALHCYNVYSVLSQHVRAGKQLADLQAQRGAIQFQRGPLSPEQVEVLKCLASAIHWKLVEDKSSDTSQVHVIKKEGC